MRYQNILHTDLRPSVLSLGTGGMGATIDRETSFRMLDLYLERGGNFIDTAKIYNDWIPGEKSRSEKVIGDWLRARGNRQRVILATKGAHPDLQSMHIPRLSPEEITADLEASLRHLRVDCIDLYWLHRDDPARPAAEILETLARLAQAGKIRAYGCSNWRLERIQAAQAWAAQNGVPGFAAVQNLWNLAKIAEENVGDKTLALMDAPLWKYHQQEQLAAIPFTSQAQGIFQKLESGGPDSLSAGQRKMYFTPETQARFQRVQHLKAQTGWTTAQIVLGYLTGQPFPTFPVIGPRSLAQLEDSLAAADVTLAPDQLAYLTQSTDALV